MRTKPEAECAGKVLLKRMRGKQWALRVWENLGWHYGVYCEPESDIRLSVCIAQDPDGSVRYSCLLGRDGAGELHWYQGEWYKDPNRAVKAQLKLARTFADETERKVAALELALAKGA